MQNMIGAYGPWAASLVGDEPARLSFRTGRWRDPDAWRETARARAEECLAQPDAGGVPEVTLHAQYEYDGLHVEELS